MQQKGVIMKEYDKLMKSLIAFIAGILLVSGAAVVAQPEEKIEATSPTPAATVSASHSNPVPPSGEDTQRCHSSYSGCLDPEASDYDCAGGSGNGPKYTGPVRVLGYDEFDLDRDHDGWGCE